MCAWSGNCYTFTINGAGHHVQYKVYVDGEIVEYNQQLLDMFDYSKEEIVNTNAFDLLTPA